MKIMVTFNNFETQEFEAEHAEERGGSLVLISKVADEYASDQIMARFSLGDVRSWWPEANENA